MATVGDKRSTSDLSEETDGWIAFSHTMEPNEVGLYHLRCEVVEGKDLIVASYFAIDNLRTCKDDLSQADLNYDCNVNLEDYSIISSAWLAFCPDIVDPNTMDPNDIAGSDIPCQLADIDNSGYVDPNDLILMSEDFLD